MSQLSDELVLSRSSGRVAFLLTGSAAESVAVGRDLARRARRSDRRLRVIVADAADPRVPAWRQVALRLTGRHRVTAALGRSLVEWAGVIPVIGPVVNAVLNTAAELSPARQSGTAALGTGSALDDVRRLLAHGRHERRMIVLTGCEAADGAELAGAFALIQQIRDTRTLLVVIAAGDAPAGARGFTDLLWEAERLGVGRRIGSAAPRSAAETRVRACAATFDGPFDAAALSRELRQPEAEVEATLEALARSGIVAIVQTVERNGDLVDLYELVATP